MFEISPSLASLAFLTLFITLLYFYIFSKNHEPYINYWGFSWTMYTISLFISMLLLNQPGLTVLIGLKVICDLLNSLFLLGGTYLFVGRKIPRYWIQFLFINLLWITLAVYYDLPVLTVTLIASVFFSVVAVATGVMLFRYWDTNWADRVIGGLVFIIWGLHKAYYPFLFPVYSDSHLGYTSEIIFANILNFSILIIYLQKIRSQLALSEKRFRLMADNAKDLIYLYQLKPMLKFEYISPSSLNMLGYEPEAFYDNPSLFSELVHPADLVMMDLLTEPDHINPGPVTIRFLHKEGHYIWTEQHTTILHDAAGHMKAVEGIARDITDRKRIEEEMMQSEKSRHSLLTNISHELRTPITSILGYVSALLDGTITMKETRINYLELIQSKALRLQRLIQDLFELTQLESGQISFNFSQVTVAEFIQNNLQKCEWDVNHAGIVFQLVNEVTLKDLQREIIVDIERMDQVISNLVFNAIRHTPQSGLIALQASVFEADHHQNLQVKVIDNGVGIDETDLKHIFERFYRGGGQKGIVYEGSGLGLTISREIIEFHGGHIWADSKLYEGSSFCFTLPLYEP
ncbi:sensor histidine kinase [Anoxynatronum sibiricum]|uniref:histidine kinase n=1 Tax=Anoxynatronum sibiricum TaxID=210623 RepID=A0ABU9VQ34_9CLOT